MLKINRRLNQLRDNFFSNIHSNNLIYNTCWEDPRCDRKMLNFNEESEVVMITSAGCNALDYLLDNPSKVHTIDMNPRQNALLALKIAFLQHSDYHTFWQFFGEGYHPEAVSIYAEQIKPNLSPSVQDFWDKQILLFKKHSFYFHGTSGTFAWLFNQYIDARPQLREKIEQLLEAKDLSEQTAIYNEVEPYIITKAVRWLMNRHLTLTLLGVPRAQRQLILDEYEEGVAGFAAECLRQVFTELPVEDNYFWRVYLKGSYTKDCAPSYLKAENYDVLRERSHNIQMHTSTISAFLKTHPKAYSQYILLDHQDWLAAHNVPALEEEWELILKNSRPGTQILMRSAAPTINFFPDFVKEAVNFHPEITDTLHYQDRVGTYASTYLMTVK